MKIPDFQRAKREGKKIVVVTGYDALFTRIIEQAGIEVILVGDSLGVVVQGKHDTLTVTMEDMVVLLASSRLIVKVTGDGASIGLF